MMNVPPPSSQQRPSTAGRARRPESRGRPGSAARSRPITAAAPTNPAPVQQQQQLQLQQKQTVDIPLVGAPVLRSVHDRVHVKMPTWSKYYGGIIAVVHTDGTYDIACDDGEKLSKVSELYIKRGSTSQLVNDGTSSVGTSGNYRPGDEVMAQIDGWNKPYKAVINRVNANGTYNLLFDDGDRVDGVDESVFREGGGQEKEISTDTTVTRATTATSEALETDLPPPAPSPTPSPKQQVHTIKRPSLMAGDRIEARAPGWTSFYKGTIINVHADDAVDVKFDDGDYKRNLRGIEVRGIGQHRASSASPVRKGRRQRPQSAKPQRSSTTASNTGTTNTRTTSTMKQQPRRPRSAPRARGSMPAGGGLTFAQWKRKTTANVYGTSTKDSRIRSGSIGLSGSSYSTGATRNKIPLSRRPKTGTKLKKMPADLAIYLSKKVNPVLRSLSENIFLDQPADLASYLNDFATKLAAKQYGNCGDIVKRLAIAMEKSGDGNKESVTALSIFQQEDDNNTGVLSYVGFVKALETFSKIYTRCKFFTPIIFIILILYCY